MASVLFALALLTLLISSTLAYHHGLAVESSAAHLKLELLNLLSIQKMALLLLGTVVSVRYLLWSHYIEAKKTLLLDLACYDVPTRMRISQPWLVDAMRKSGWFTRESLEFQERIMERSGLGDQTGLSDGLMDALARPDTSLPIPLSAAQDETEEVIFTVVGELLEKTGVHPQQIDIVMTSCNGYAPTPSMAEMLVKRFGMRPDVLTYHFAGMGCGSTLVCVDLARHLLSALPERRVLVVNHENMTSQLYNGNDRSMLIVNCIFRMGGAAALLTNRRQDRARAKYELATTLRTHLGYEDDAFGCMGVAEDADGKRGCFLRKSVVETASRALRLNLTGLAPRVLPYLEQVKCVLDRARVPDFSRAFEHFLLHTSRGVLEEVERKLRLTSAQVQPAKDTLERFGNTSAASTWYILARIEATSGVRRGDRLWQLGFGGGFKCGSAVWWARRNIRQQHACWA